MSQSHPGAGTGWLMDLGRFLVEFIAVGLALVGLSAVLWIVARGIS